MTPEITKLIEDNRERPISEAPRDGTTILARIDGVHPDSGEPYKYAMVQFNSYVDLFIDEKTADELYDMEEDFEMSSSMQEWFESLAYWRPLPDNRLADAFEVAISGVDDIAMRAGQLASGDYKASGHSAEEIGIEILHTLNYLASELQKIAERKE